MSTPRGNFVWYELMTTDTTSAIAFYRRVIGWGAEAAGLPDREYTILKAGDTLMGGGHGVAARRTWPHGWRRGMSGSQQGAG